MNNIYVRLYVHICVHIQQYIIGNNALYRYDYDERQYKINIDITYKWEVY